MRFSSLSYFEKWFVMGLIIGVVAGLGALAFYFSIRLFEFLFLSHLVQLQLPRPVGEGGSGSYAFEVGRYYLIPVSVMLGNTLSGLIVYTFAPEAEGHGSDAAINAYHNLQGKIRRRVIPVKTIASAITIGSGGSAGREGPTAQIAAGIGSVLADLLRLSPEDRRRAVAVGIGAGIGTIFKTPIGGAILAAEILYKRDLEAEVIYPALVASAVGYSIFGSVVGFEPIFGYYSSPFDPLRLPMYAALGVLAGLLARLYVRTFYAVSSFFKSLKVTDYVKPLLGGAVAGTLSLAFPEVMSTGYGWVQLLMYQSLSSFPTFGLPVVLIVVILPLVKILATSFTIGSGGSGGVFAPGLFIGASLGASVGLAMGFLFPSVVPSIVPFVIVGMISLFGAAGKAPLAVLVMVVEMTGSLQLLPGAMIAVAISYLVSGSDSIYKSQVVNRRESPAHKSEYERPILASIRLSEVPLRNFSLRESDDVDRAREIMKELGVFSVPVVSGSGKFLGSVYLQDIDWRRGSVSEFVVRGSPSVRPTSTAEEALEIMSKNRSRWVAVVERGEFKGVVLLEDLLEAYRRELSKVKETRV